MFVTIRCYAYGLWNVKYNTQRTSSKLKLNNFYCPRQQSKLSRHLLMTINIENEDIVDNLSAPVTAGPFGPFREKLIIDRNSVRYALTSQGLLLITALAFGAINRIELFDINALNVNFDSMWLALRIGLATLGNLQSLIIITICIIPYHIIPIHIIHYNIIAFHILS